MCADVQVDGGSDGDSVGDSDGDSDSDSDSDSVGDKDDSDGDKDDPTYGQPVRSVCLLPPRSASSLACPTSPANQRTRTLTGDTEAETGSRKGAAATVRAL